MIIQLQQKSLNGDVILCAQRDINSAKENEEFIEEIQAEYSLPTTNWLACSEESEFFLGTPIT